MVAMRSQKTLENTEVVRELIQRFPDHTVAGLAKESEFSNHYLSWLIYSNAGLSRLYKPKRRDYSTLVPLETVLQTVHDYPHYTAKQLANHLGIKPVTMYRYISAYSEIDAAYKRKKAGLKTPKHYHALAEQAKTDPVVTMAMAEQAGVPFQTVVKYAQQYPELGLVYKPRQKILTDKALIKKVWHEFRTTKLSAFAVGKKLGIHYRAIYRVIHNDPDLQALFRLRKTKP